MKFMIGLAISWLGIALCAAHAAPARPLYQPPDPPKSAEFFILHDTVWEGSFFQASGKTVRITFMTDGRVVYQGLSGKGVDKTSPGNWKLTGNKIAFDVNKYSEHVGTLVGDVIEGESTNKGGLRGPFRLQRVGPMSK